LAGACLTAGANVKSIRRRQQRKIYLLKEKNMAGNRMSKSEFLAALAEKTGLNKKQAGSAMDAVSAIVSEQLKSNGEVTIPGLIKLNISIKAATPEHEGINPFTKQPTMIKAKPERKVVKARPVKALKDAV
jgi:nucleoid DNA-binding protein